jgi:hypothetical protein
LGPQAASDANAARRDQLTNAVIRTTNPRERATFLRGLRALGEEQPFCFCQGSAHDACADLAPGAEAMPSKYGANLAPGTKHVETLRREWEAEQRAEGDRKEGEALERMDRKTHNLRAHFLRSIAHDPAKRAAWDLLAGIAYGVAEEDREAEATRRAEATEHVKQGATPKP